MEVVEIEKRIRKYLERDRKGIRKEILRIILESNVITTEDVHRKLLSKGYYINQRGVSAMIGLISAKLGILRTELGEKNKYYLKREFENLLRELLK
ncbi:MAG: DUF2551 domain-containing protein [Archaeoglobaceae archaeon]|nr:DUF2551 domain-containing protein [Archaeoglobaceae archaeon]MCX8152619.1 DUF2551 domain-containing protein [Archaeoglobaceae archaeon]MDW8014099.1 DUF2551 domain-containing protein [Archaeoglobaceae archaeon]